MLDVASINFVEYDLDITTMNEVDESSSDRSQWKAPPVRVEPMNEWTKGVQLVFVHHLMR